MALKTGTDDRPVGATQNGQEKLTPKLTPFSTPTAFSKYDRSSTIGNEQGNSPEKDDIDNYSNDRHLGKENDRLATVGMGVNGKGGGRIRTDDNGFAIRRLGPLGYAAVDEQIYLPRGPESRDLLMTRRFEVPLNDRPAELSKG